MKSSQFSVHSSQYFACTVLFALGFLVPGFSFLDKQTNDRRIEASTPNAKESTKAAELKTKNQKLKTNQKPETRNEKSETTNEKPETRNQKLPRINSARAIEYVRQIVGMGPRPVGSAVHKRVEDYLLSHLKASGAAVEEDSFEVSTPIGRFPMRNIIGKFPGTRDGIIVIGSHYDTNYGLKNYVGANDGGSSSGLLLELANQLRSQGKREGYSVWLVFLDGEEKIQESAQPSEYGSGHLVAKWQGDGTGKKIKAFLLADMIGDAELDIDRDSNSTSWLEDLVYAAASKYGYQSHFFQRTIGVDDDHTPFLKAGIPSADLIDFTYGYNNVFWHTPQDTLDKLSPQSLQITGDTLLETLRLLDRAAGS